MTIAPRVLSAHMAQELATQPALWSRVQDDRSLLQSLPNKGMRIAVIGCGTSWFMAQSYAWLRERRGHGVTDAYAASEAFVDRGYEAVVAISRSGTTTEVLELVNSVRREVRTIAIVGDRTSPLTALVDDAIGLPFADEQSVVQTRFATSALALLRAPTGEPLDGAIADAELALSEEIEPALLNAGQVTFLGRGWTIGLAHEAALKMREASQAWTESYPAMEYRHGPIAIASAGRAVWHFGAEPTGLAEEVRDTGAHFEAGRLDAMAELVRAQRVSLERARRQGIDADRPRNLSRSVVLAD